MSGNRPHRAFTLVELLTVIVIIGMLVSLLIPAIGAVMRRTKDFRTATDIAKLEQAVELYKDKYGDYPPDFAELANYHVGNSDDILTAVFDRTTIIGHLRRAFPKITPTEVNHFKKYLRQEVFNSRRPTPPDSLFFWLGGLSGNVQRPFTGAGGP
ncbi:MAG: prepilin-type N-terminal cleavage/methylation domain-containing protein, partial [Pirellulaceae bacterium]